MDGRASTCHSSTPYPLPSPTTTRVMSGCLSQVAPESGKSHRLSPHDDGSAASRENSNPILSEGEIKKEQNIPSNLPLRTLFILSPPNNCIWVKIVIDAFYAWALVDTGSEYKRLFFCIWSRMSITLSHPLTSVNIKGVVTTKRCRITRQCFIHINIQEQLTFTTFLIVPGLGVDTILGCEWCEQNMVTITFNENRSLTINNMITQRQITTYRSVLLM